MFYRHYLIYFLHSEVEFTNKLHVRTLRLQTTTYFDQAHSWSVVETRFKARPSSSVTPALNNASTGLCMPLALLPVHKGAQFLSDLYLE